MLCLCVGAELNVSKLNFVIQTIFFLVARVIKQEEGKKLADSWGAAFMESSAKENEVMMRAPFGSLRSPLFSIPLAPRVMNDVLSVQTAVEVFKRIILEIEKADGNAPAVEKKCAVM